jgi:hypothetical protein
MSVAYPPGWEKRGGPPWYIHLAVHRDAEFALNRFFLALLSQVAFFPVLSRVPPFDVMLQGASNEVMTRAGYQFDLAGVLRAAPENAYITPTHNPVVDRAIDVLAPNGARVAALQYLPWQDGAVIRAFGMEPIIKQLMVTLAIPKDTLLVVDPSQPNMWLTTITKISESEFRRWATVIERKSNLRTKLIWGKEQRGASDIGRSQT